MRSSSRTLSSVIPSILLIFAINTHTISQVSDVSFEQIFLEEGLSQSIVKCILQDRNGFMYFGTEDGLNIYDAYNFEVLRNSPTDSNSLSYNDITSICEDESGRLWIGTFNSGINLYTPETKKFIRFYYNPKDNNSLSNDNINAITKDSYGNIWIGTDYGLNCINSSTSSDSNFIIKRGIELFNNKFSLDNVRVFSLLADKNGALWVGTSTGLFKIFKENRNNFYRITDYVNLPYNNNSISNNSIKAIYEDIDGDIWFGTDYGLNRLPSNEKEKSDPYFQKFFHSHRNNKTLTHNEISAICEDASGMIWIGTNGGGINIYDKKKKQFTFYQNDPLDNRSLSTNEIRALFLDRSGIMWIGTYGGGINKVSRRTGQFYHYKHRTNDSNSLSHSIVWSFYQEDSILWIGTHNGLDRLDRKTNKYIHYINIPGQNSLSNNIVRVIIPAGNGKLLIGTNGGGIDEFDTRTGTFKNWSNNKNNPNSLIYNEIRSIYKDREGKIWIGTYGSGLDKLNPETGLFTHYFNIPDDATSLSHNYVRVIAEDNEGYLWIGTEGGGLNKFDKKTGRFIRYRAGDKIPDALSSDYVFSILIDSAGFFWIGTYGGGLNKFYPESGRCEVYTVENGLPSNSIYGILKDQKGYLWLSTTLGLSKFNPGEEKFKNYNIKDGLQDNEFNGGAYFKSKSGELFFGGINGFNVFYPDNIKDNNYIPPVVLTSFKKFNEEVDFSKPLTEVDVIELPYSDNNFSFEFAALDYFSPEKNRYAYKLAGVDKDWVYVNADKRFAVYTTLSPGEYIFYVKGSNSDGIWNEEGIKLLIKIIPPFWQRLWFLFLISAMIIISGYLFYLRRLRIVRMRAELQTAHNAQLSIMPQADPSIDKLEVSGTCIPANEVGGDFFDYFYFDDQKKKFGIILGDVSGKAMKAAVTAIMVSGMILSEIRANKCINKILGNLNSALSEKIEKNMFVSLCICVIDTDSRTLLLANAGLNRPILLSNGEIELLKTAGPRLPLGVRGDIQYEQSKYNLKKGDLIILTTDGIDEAQNSNRELFGTPRLKSHLLSLNGNDIAVSVIKDSIIKEVQKFIKSDKPNDDMTVLVVRMK